MAGAAAAIPALFKTAGAAALAKPALTGAVLGALTNRQDPLRGAVLGGFTGGLTGGLVNPQSAIATAAPSVAAPVTTVGGQAALNAANAATVKSSAAMAAPKALNFSAVPTEVALSAPATKATLGQSILATAKDKPMETMQFASALGGGEQQQAPAPSMAPITQPGGFGNVPTIEESIGMDSGPRFVSKGLFDESKRSMEEEEMALMYQKLSEAGLV
jgi:hypothetical protein